MPNKDTYNITNGAGTRLYLGSRELIFSPRGLNICGRLIPPKEKEQVYIWGAGS